MIETRTGASGITVRPHPLGGDWHAILSSNDPWYRLFKSIADLFIAGEIDIRELQSQEARWSTVYKSGVGHFTREFACPAAEQMIHHLALAWMEPDCLCNPYTKDVPCDCVPMDRRERLRELIGG